MEGVCVEVTTLTTRTLTITLTTHKIHYSSITTQKFSKKSRIRETSNLSTDADRRTDTILESLRDLSKKERKKRGG